MHAATTEAVQEPGGARAQRPFWQEAIAPYARSSLRRAVLDVGTSVVPYLGLMAAMVWSLDVSYLLTLVLAIPTSGFLVRTFIVFHDCAHGSFLPSKAANARLGAVLGVLLFTPFASWRHSHAVHHATSGDLDRRGVGDVTTMTVAEYEAASWRARLAYRVFRNPLVMFGIGPIYAMVLQPRLVPRAARPRIRRSLIGTDVALVVLVGGLCWLLGWQAYLLVQGPVVVMAGATGVWLFYVQHQFEDAYWQSGDDWSFADAALRGSSYLKLPPLLRFFTGNIGLHHVHHLSARVPNYHLRGAHDATEIFADVPILTLWDGLRAVRLKLWDGERHRMVTFAEARSRGPTSSSTRRDRAAGQGRSKTSR